MLAWLCTRCSEKCKCFCDEIHRVVASRFFTPLPFGHLPFAWGRSFWELLTWLGELSASWLRGMGLFMNCNPVTSLRHLLGLRICFHSISELQYKGSNNILYMQILYYKRCNYLSFFCLHTHNKNILLFAYSYKAKEAFLHTKNNLDGLEELKGQLKRSKPPV